MIRDLNRGAAIEAISSVVKEQDDAILQEMYRYLEGEIDQTDILLIWHGLKPLENLSDRAIRGILKFLESKGKIGEYLDFFVEIDTSPIKKEFLSSIENEKTRSMVASNLELLTENIESVYQKDLCQLSLSEAIDGLKNLPALNVSALNTILSSARKYCKWCEENGKFNNSAQNPFKKIKTRDIPLEPWIEKNVVKSPLELYLKINGVVPFDCGYLAPVVVVLAWMGFKNEECIRLKMEEVDLFDKTIKGKIIPDEFIPIIAAYYHFVEDMESENGVFLRHHLINRVFGRPFKNVDISNAFCVYQDLTFYNVRVSSQLYALYLAERAGIKLDQHKIAEMFDLNVSATDFISVVKNKQALYNAYKKVYWN